MRSSTTDIAAGLFCLFTFLIFFAQADTLQGMARSYPLGLLIAIALGASFLLVKGIRKRRSGLDPIPENAEDVAIGRVAFILAASIAYVFVIELVGFYIASVIFLFGSGIALSDVQASGGWKKLALASAIFTVVMCISVWLMFVAILYVPTPEGSLFYR